MSKKKLIPLVTLLIGIFLLPVLLFQSKEQQDNRPLAFTGGIELILSSSSQSPVVGDTLDVVVSMQVAEPNTKVSGIDFHLLYGKEVLEVVSISPVTRDIEPTSGFTEVIVKEDAKPIDGTFNAVRLGLISNLPFEQLPAGISSLAKVTFRVKKHGQIDIQLPKSEEYLQVAGEKRG